MRHLLLIFCAAFGSAAWGQSAPPSCQTPPRVAPLPSLMNPDPASGDYCVTVYLEVDHDIVADKGPVESRTYIEGLLGEVSTLYAAQDITLGWIVKYWDTPSPYNGATSQENLYQFRDHLNAQGGHDGDVAQLLSYRSSGGIAFVDVFCSEGFGYAFSSIGASYQPYPAYSWSVVVIAHELGHNLGSPHTHSCSWPGGAIDGCSPFGTEGNCPNPGNPAQGGTVMSYCHLTSSGTNLSRGFHPLPLALIKNRIAAGPCADCDVPDGPDDPEPPTCDGNQVIMELQLDNYPQETSWAILDDALNVVAQSEPFAKDQMNTYHADTLCLPDGCYTLVVTDPDGLTGYGCGEGLYLLNGPNGQELASGQDWEGQDMTVFCFGDAPPGPDECLTAGPYADALQPYVNQDQLGGVSVSGENMVKLSGNTWKAYPMNYSLTTRTVLIGQVKIEGEGEIHGVALVDNVGALAPGNTVRFGGTQAWGRAGEQVPHGEWKDIEIPVGEWIGTGDYTHIVLINDHDVPSPQAVTGWRNLELCESGAESLRRARPQVQGKAEDEAIVEDIILKPHPNPTTDTVTLPAVDAWILFGSDGRHIRTGHGNLASLRLLPPGLYLIWQSGNTYKIQKQ